MINQTFSFVDTIIGTEILALLICLILLLGCRIGKNRTSKHSHWYCLLIIAAMLGCFADMLSWLLDGCAGMNLVLYLTTTVSISMTLVMVGIFISYLAAYLEEKGESAKIPTHAIWLTVALGVLATVSTSVTGDLFFYQQGVYVVGPLYPLYVIFNIGYIVIGIITVTLHRKNFALQDKVAAYAYMIIPIISACMGLFVEGWDFTYPAITLSLLILYIMLQSDQVKILEEERKTVSYIATHDELTGLYNRRAFQEHLKMLLAKDGKSGVIFGDLNGLKYANDTFGHEAGDKLLLRYATLLKKLFRMQEVYRISGDEFICILENVQEEVFNKRIGKLEAMLQQEQPPLACIGTAYGCNRNLSMLLREAEAKMYVQKETVHADYHKLRR